MIQSRRGTSLAPETIKGRWIASQDAGKEFDRDVPVQPRIASFVNLSHSARSQKL
jgi:hypothetical protein